MELATPPEKPPGPEKLPAKEEEYRAGGGRAQNCYSLVSTVAGAVGTSRKCLCLIEKTYSEDK
jgi:hypothetical protein